MNEQYQNSGNSLQNAQNAINNDYSFRFDMSAMQNGIKSIGEIRQVNGLSFNSVPGLTATVTMPDGTVRNAVYASGNWVTLDTGETIYANGGVVPPTQTITTVPNNSNYIWSADPTVPSLMEQLLLKRIEELERRLGSVDAGAWMARELEVEQEDKEPKPSRKFRKVTEETL